MKRFNCVSIAIICCLSGLWLLFQTAKLSGEQTYLPVSSSNASGNIIALTTENNLLVLNPDSDSITIIDTTTAQLLKEIPVGKTPRNVVVDEANHLVYVSNWGANTISVIDLDMQQVVDEYTVGHRPYGLALNPTRQWLFVAEQGQDRLRIIDTVTAKTINMVHTKDRPTRLVLSEDGHTLYITHLLNNNITVFDAGKPYRAYLPFTFSATNHSEPFQHQDQTVSASEILLWPDSNLVHSFVIAPDGQTAYVPHTRFNTNNRALTFDTAVFPLVSLIDLNTQQHLVGQQFDLGTLDPPGVGLPMDAAVSANGTELWVVNGASNDLTVINTATRSLQAHIEVADNPRGIVFAHDGTTAYVNNSLAGTVSVIDTAVYTVTTTITTTQIPLPPLLLEGKRLFHSSDDSRLSKDQWIACNTCHFEGEQDGRTWFFGFSGPRNTTSLLGMVQTYPLRWSGEWDESADSEFAIRKENFGTGLINDAMHCELSPPDCVNQPPNQGREDALDALAAYMDFLTVPLSPNHANGEPLSPSEQRGRAIFNDLDLGCIGCHPPPYYTDQMMHDVGTTTSDEKIGHAYDTPSLRGLYDSAPYFHDGSSNTLYEAVTRPSSGSEHDVQSSLNEQEIQDLITFLLALPYE